VARLGPPLPRSRRQALIVAIRDLLWACPACGAVGGIGPDGRCRCGLAFARGQGSLIEARFPDGRVDARSPAQWLDHLPHADSLLTRGEGDVLRQAHVIAREATGTKPVRKAGRFLNRIERYGPKRRATLEMRPHGLIYQPEGVGPRAWSYDALTAVQTSSSTLQLRARDGSLLSFGFPDDSILLWELLLHAAIRDFYRRTGRGEIAEFQPRIATR
jgi:hypothetical protein